MTYTPYTMQASAWEHYLKYRPSYPDSMWSSWVSYHHGPLQTIHDIGTGTGLATRKMIEAAGEQGHDITRAHLSDPGESNLALAQRLLSSSSSSSSSHGPRPPPVDFTFHPHKIEQDAFLPPGSVDLAMACECFHWTAFDTETAMDRIGESLRPGGTFAAVFYHLVGVVEGNARAADALDRVQAERHTGMLQQEVFSTPIYRRVLMNCGLRLDFVPFDKEKWMDVRRLYINVDVDGGGKPRWPWAETVWPSGARLESRVDNMREAVEVIRDEGWDIPECTVEWVRQCLISDRMGFDESTWESEAWKDFENAVQEGGGRFYLRMPAVMVLGRRR